MQTNLELEHGKMQPGALRYCHPQLRIRSIEHESIRCLFERAKRSEQWNGRQRLQGNTDWRWVPFRKRGENRRLRERDRLKRDSHYYQKLDSRRRWRQFRRNKSPKKTESRFSLRFRATGQSQLESSFNCALSLRRGFGRNERQFRFEHGRLQRWYLQECVKKILVFFFGKSGFEKHKKARILQSTKSFQFPSLYLWKLRLKLPAIISNSNSIAAGPHRG